MDLRSLADKTERERETERVSNSNLLAWQRPGAGDQHTMQGAHGSMQRAITSAMSTRCLGTSSTVVAHDISKKSEMFTDSLDFRLPITMHYIVVDMYAFACRSTGAKRGPMIPGSLS